MPLNDRPETHGSCSASARCSTSTPATACRSARSTCSTPTAWSSYYGDGDELHLAFNFPPLFAPWRADKWRRQIEIVEDEHGAVGAWPTWVLSNHDNLRHRTRYGSEARARAAAVLLLTLRGTPFLYAGEELGLEDAVVPPDRVVDPGGRDGCRAPIPWDATAHARLAGRATRGSPGPPRPRTRNVVAERADPASMLHLYRRLLAGPARARPRCTQGRSRCSTTCPTACSPTSGSPTTIAGWC